MMVVMLILSLVLAASVPIMTKQQKSLNAATIPRGVIVVWHGSVATIPTGWHLCDGTAGTPDLRSRFVYGAGGDTNTKATVVSGWDTAADGHWNVGLTGGEENHVLSIAEMPSHLHTGTATTNGNHNHRLYVFNANGTEDHTCGFSYDNNTAVMGKNNSPLAYRTTNGNGAELVATSGNHSHTVSIDNNGGGTTHNILPRLMVLAYIMKL